MANPSLTVIAAAGGQTAAAILRGNREAAFKTQTMGYQNLGTIDNITGSAGADESKLTHSRYQVLYDPTGNIIYAVAI